MRIQRKLESEIFPTTGCCRSRQLRRASVLRLQTSAERRRVYSKTKALHKNNNNSNCSQRRLDRLTLRAQPTSTPCSIYSPVNLIRGTGIQRADERGMHATLLQGNQELLVVTSDKVGRLPGELGVSKSMECDIFPSVL